jgi:hypothetical protein
MLKNEIEVGDCILITSGTSTAILHNFIGKVLIVTHVDPSGGFYPFQATDGMCGAWWVNGVPVTDLIKALV